MDNIFRPFIGLLWLGLLNEILSFFLSFTIKSNMMNSNIYVLLEYALIIYQFRRWDNLTAGAGAFFVAAGLAVWVADNFFINSIHSRSSISRIGYSFIIILFSINEINRLIVFERRSLLKNPVFLICFTFLVYYSYKAFAEVFIAFNLSLSREVYAHIALTVTVINFISNILYTIAVLCIPPKLEFTMPY